MAHEVFVKYINGEESRYYCSTLDCATDKAKQLFENAPVFPNSRYHSIDFIDIDDDTVYDSRLHWDRESNELRWIARCKGIVIKEEVW